MKCFHVFNNKRNIVELRKSRKSNSILSCNSNSTSMNQDLKMFDSDVNSQNVSEFSAASSAISFAALSQRHSNLREFTFSDLKAATKNFSRSLMIGEGGFGSVYRGAIHNSDDPRKRIDIAVKQLSRRGLQGHKEWVTEVNFLGVVEHPNLVKLLGYCAEDDERGIQRLLVYEYMPNRSVQDHLSSRFNGSLPWAIRMKIAQDAARGLAYLHEGMDFQIIFRDFKASNILLDDHWNAKLSDFGLARLGPSDGLSHVSTAIVGTIGYAAPEYLQTGRLTAKIDVWSYGVFLYELITGRRPLDRNRPKGEQKLLEWVRPHLSDIKKFELIMDPRLEGKYSLKAAHKLAAVANRCLVRKAAVRPKMSEVLEMVTRIVEGDYPESPLLPVKSLSSNNDSEGSKSEPLRKRIMNSFIGENGCLIGLAWRPKVVRTC
ncbi:probable serine/threonine-protein kinase PBL19 [Cucurbita maxima]|uniref:non-specific serine/threonine protein kinase n=1 Tax=Cucurbita maxima TaxID=3661 RepID=A0A6J1JT24_CUCMA|nr:probable serine/threonine-protein kinase PBL19 [Cucurbita maxima]XP_022990365.1 probable serine/threonine-protein kinase PBL19 [Cucurbita maxima]XP_022990366.1 probable serine/threonine-protein kinase PBL19 [Cucurbita maxima]XP_022990367.1 probable serine/threonine-protein kinase PBL19 [Cucurbita maxima]